MRIEKVSENQIKIFLSNEDLIERGVTVKELAYGSEKTKKLFEEVMEEASRKHNFYFDGQLLIEAVPMNMDGLTISVTKFDPKNKNFNFLAGKPNKQRIQNVAETDEQEFDDRLKEKMVIFSFQNLDDIIAICPRIYYSYFGNSVIYKYNEKYFLVLEQVKTMNSENYILQILREYGERHLANDLSRQFLVEHGETIVADRAIEKLLSLN